MQAYAIQVHLSIVGQHGKGVQGLPIVRSVGSVDRIVTPLRVVDGINGVLYNLGSASLVPTPKDFRTLLDYDARMILVERIRATLGLFPRDRRIRGVLRMDAVARVDLDCWLIGRHDEPAQLVSCSGTKLCQIGNSLNPGARTP